MLEKITNINLRSEFFKDQKAVSAYKNSYRAHALRNDVHDSVNLSPAYRFLAQINWRLKEMNTPAPEKIYVSFLFGGYEFQTTVDLSNITKLSSLDYTVMQEENLSQPGFVTSAAFTVLLNKGMHEPSEAIIDLPGFKVLFRRLSNLNFLEELNVNNNMLYELFDGIATMIAKEFDYLNSCLFTFLEKMTNMKILKQNLGDPAAEHPEIPNKIKLLRVDARKK